MCVRCRPADSEAAAAPLPSPLPLPADGQTQAVVTSMWSIFKYKILQQMKKNHVDSDCQVEMALNIHCNTQVQR